LLIPPGRIIEMAMPDLLDEQVTLTADGQQEHELAADDIVRVTEAECTARFVVPPDSSFYARLRNKLGWGSSREGR
jgi:NAD kinase